MSTIAETKQRLKSIKSTRKITNAMELVASVKFKRSMKNLDKIQEYYTSVFETFQRLFANTKNLAKMFPVDQTKPCLFILITSNLGLCGAYIANVMRHFYKEYRPSDKVIVLGTRGAVNLRAKGIPIFQEVTDLHDIPRYENASLFGLEALSHFITGEVSEVRLIYTKFINSISFETKSMTLMPITPETTMVQHTKSSDDLLPPPIVEFEPSPEEVVKESIRLYISSIIYGAMVESKTSEMASRRTAMENATDNADELIEKLNIQYNRARQAEITQEISEIVAGVESS